MADRHGKKSCGSPPTLMDDVTWKDAVMGEEIFGPLLPILTYHTLEEAVKEVRSHPCPLALYIFSSNKRNIAYVKDRVSFGGGMRQRYPDPPGHQRPGLWRRRRERHGLL